MANIIDSYSETNENATSLMSTGNAPGFAQMFTGNGATLGSAQFYMDKTSSPSGNVVAKIYAISGAFGSTAIPTGTALATSDPVVASSLPTSLALITFTFSGANQIVLSNGTNYAVSTEYSGALGLQVGIDSTSPTHPGNKAQLNTAGTVWTAASAVDLPFYVFDNSSGPTVGTDPAMYMQRPVYAPQNVKPKIEMV